jgi:hypothetical protein
MPYNLLMPEKEGKSMRRPRWLWRWWFALATLFILVWWLMPPLLYRQTGAGADTRVKAITDTRTSLIAALLGVGTLLTLWLNTRVYRMTAATFELTERGHITERYTKAIEQLGSDKLNVRLGSIYTLEHIASDSERDHPMVVEVLSVLVREASDPVKRFRASLPHDANPIVSPEAEQAAALELVTHEGLPPDVQAALTVLGRLPSSPYVSRGDLTGAYLQGADLHGADLHGADLQGADLQGADLQKAQLQGTQLQGAQLQGRRQTPTPNGRMASVGGRLVS